MVRPQTTRPTKSAGIHVPTHRLVTMAALLVTWLPSCPWGSHPVDAVPLLAQPLSTRLAATIRPVTAIPRRVWRAVGRGCVRKREPSGSAEPRGTTSAYVATLLGDPPESLTVEPSRGG